MVLASQVWFCANGARPAAAAFQSYSVHSAAELAKTPSNLTSIEAATVPTGIVTAGVALFRTLNLDLALLANPPALAEADKPWMLVWGGAGSTGVFLIQLARLAGFRVVCAASPVNEEYVRSLGADVVLDRWQTAEQLVDQIRVATGDNVLLAVDNVGPKTAALCAEVVAGSALWRKANNIETPSDAPTTARLLAIAGSPKLAPPSTSDDPAPTPPDALRSVAQPRLSFSTTFYGHPAFSAPFLDAVSAALAAGQVKPGRSRVIEGGLGGIEAGLGELKSGSGQGGFKLVARLGGGRGGEEGRGVEEVGVPEEEVVEVKSKRGLEEEVDGEGGAAKRSKTVAIAEPASQAEVDAVTYRM